MSGFAIIQNLLVNFCVLLVIGFPSSIGQTTTSKNVICHYNYLAELNLPDIDASICTHIVLHSSYVIPIYSSVDDSGMSQWLEQFMDLRLSNPSLKIRLAVSGLDGHNPRTTYSYKDRQTFYNQHINILRSWDFDGVNFQWNDYPNQNIVTFAEEIRVALTDEATSSGREPLIFMLRLPGCTGAMAVAQGVDFQPLGEAVDILEVTLLDGKFKFTYPHTTNALANPLYGNGGYRGKVSASTQCLTTYLDLGVAPEKLHMEVELFASLFTLDDPQPKGVGAPVPNRYRLEKLPYSEVCRRLQVEGYTAAFDPEGLVNYAKKDYQWMKYEDQVTLEIKMNYVQEHNLGGVTVKFLEFDDFTGEFCNQGRYPLTSTLYTLASSGITTTTPLPTRTTPSKNVICYYHYFGGLNISNISKSDVSICTHLVYDYAYIPSNDLVIRGDSGMSERLKQFMDLRFSNPSLKILLAVSGLDNYGFKVRSTYEDRQTLYNNAINFLRSWDFDGVNFP